MKNPKKQPGRRGDKTLDLPRANRSFDGDKVKRTGLGVEPQNRRQHKYGSDHGVEEELHRRVHLPPVAVHADQQRHGDQRGLPEEVEEEQIEGDKHADQRGFQHQQNDEEFLHPLADRLPGNQHAERSEKRGQHDQPRRNSVHADVIVNIGSRNPGVIDFKLEAALQPVKMCHQMQGSHKRQERNNQ